jgi:hypothetical protein
MDDLETFKRITNQRLQSLESFRLALEPMLAAWREMETAQAQAVEHATAAAAARASEFQAQNGAESDPSSNAAADSRDPADPPNDPEPEATAQYTGLDSPQAAAEVEVARKPGPKRK